MANMTSVTPAEVAFREELDVSRAEYEKALDAVRAKYLDDLEKLHRAFAHRQSVALDTYHASARAQLSEMLRQLEPIAAEHEMSAQLRDIVSIDTGEVLRQTNVSDGSVANKQPDNTTWQRFIAPDPDSLPVDVERLPAGERWHFRHRSGRHGA